jgi:phage terminase large subunit-like protein
MADEGRPIRTRAERVIAFIELYCRVPEGSRVGELMILDEFQRRFVTRVYDNPEGTRRGILSLGRKNGKTGLIAGILLAHIAGPEAIENSQIISGGMSRDQAALVFNLAVKIVNLSPQLRDLVHIVPSFKKLIGLRKNVEYRALASESSTAHGLSPVLAILDELGQVRGPRDGFVDAITTSQGAHSAPLLLVISTQAASDDDLLSIWIDDALTGADPHTVCDLYTTPKDADLMSEEGWRAANPASFRSFADIREQAGRAVRMPSFESTFRNLILNQRVNAETAFIARSVWEENGGEPEDFDGPVYGGLDLASRIDLCAMVLAGQRFDDAAWNVRLLCWAPLEGVHERAKRDRVPYDLWAKDGLLRLTPGRSVDYEIVANDIAEACADLDVRAIGFDRWRIDVLRKEFARIGFGVELIPFGQGFKDMSPALDLVENELLNARVRHGMHPILTMGAAQAKVMRDPAGNRKLTKMHANARIDALVALVMALGTSQMKGDVADVLDAEQAALAGDV